jgi:hypothetical protein
MVAVAISERPYNSVTVKKLKRRWEFISGEGRKKEKKEGIRWNFKARGRS